MLGLWIGSTNSATKASQSAVQPADRTHSAPFFLQQVSGPAVQIIANSHSGPVLLPTDTPTDPPTPWGSPTPTQDVNNPAVTPSEPPNPTNTPFPLLITSVDGRFFPNTGNICTFSVTTATPAAFSEQFPVVGFNPPGGVSIGCPGSANESTHPFTDVLPGTPGTPCVQQPAQFPWPGTPTVQAGGVGSLDPFYGVFKGQFYAGESGEVTFKFWSDDGWVLGIGPKVNGNGEQPLYVRGEFTPPTPGAGTPWPMGPFTQYRVVGRFDQISGVTTKMVTVNFPAAGYCPFELDYTECHFGELSLLMGTTAGNIIPPGPSATPTFTPTPTSTPTTTPISQPPTYTVSYYVRQTSRSASRSLGCAVRERQVGGIAVLDFGVPYDFAQSGSTSHIYGTKLPTTSTSILLWPPSSDSLTDNIYDDALQFAYGYALGCDIMPRPNPNMNLTVAIGASNSYLTDPSGRQYPDPYLTYEHGQSWAQMVDAVNGQLNTLGFWPKLQAVGAYDAEPAWSWKWDYNPTYAWAKGYSIYANATSRQAPLFDFGSCDGCVRNQPRSSWSSASITELDQVYKLSRVLPLSRALPEIYHPPLAEEWYNVRRWANENGGWMDVAGVMTECGDSNCNFQNSAAWVDAQFNCSVGDCTDLPPNQGWQALHDIHNAPCTPDSTVHPILSLPLQCSQFGTPNTILPPHIGFLTDIRVQPTATPTP